MKNIDVRGKCWLCSCYSMISYADGSSAAGCTKASEDGRPVDVRHLERCPRGHFHSRCKELDKQALLSVLGDLYTLIAVHPAYLALYSKISGAPSLAGKKTLIALAIQQLGIIERVDSRMEGQSGRRCTYRWNRKAGPPSLEMVERIAFKVTELTFDMVDKRRDALDSKTWKPRKPKISKKLAGVTSCSTCRLKDIKDCRAKLIALGYDCKKINVNALDDEVTVGF